MRPGYWFLAIFKVGIYTVIMNLLFICKHNVMRSRTAESVYSSDDRYNARSAGTGKTAKVKVTAEMIKWADIIFVMEEEQELYIKEEFGQEVGHREIITLGIYDTYYFMEPALVDLIKEKVEPYLEDTI
jgi:predicted protein tyrosine phosphatase